MLVAAQREPIRQAKSQTKSLLLVGFGGLLVLLAVTGLNAVSVLRAIQMRNESIREDYIHRSRILEELRSDVYLSGTYARDFLIDPDQAGADAHRRDLDRIHARIESMIAAYRTILRPDERSQFEQFAREVASYFSSLNPAMQWDASERRRFGFAFMQESLLPRRMTLVHLADQISQVNTRQLEAGNRQVADLFSNFRRNLLLLLAGTLLVGLLLAGGSIYRVLKLERLSERRFAEAVEVRAALRDLSARLVDVQENERRALSRELHDEVGQVVSGLLLAVGNVAATISPHTIESSKEQLEDIRRVAEKTVSVVRDMSLLLRPSMLDDLGLIPALEWQAREASRTNNIHVTVNADSILDDEIPEEQKTCVYRVAQEALRNVARHAKASCVEIRLSQDRNQLHLVIRDDGQGFEPKRQKGVGLLGMQERVRRLNGSFAIESQPGHGTTVKADLPHSAENNTRAI